MSEQSEASPLPASNDEEQLNASDGANANMDDSQNNVRSFPPEKSAETANDTGIQSDKTFTSTDERNKIASRDEQDHTATSLAAPEKETPEAELILAETLPEITELEITDPTEATTIETEPVLTITGPGLALSRHNTGALRKNARRVARRVRRQQRGKPHVRPLTILLLAIFLLGVVAPLAVTIGYGIQLYTTYTQLRTHADQGISHLMSIKDILQPTGGTTGTGGSKKQSLLDTSKLAAVQSKLVAANDDFTQMQHLLKDTNLSFVVTRIAPQYQPALTSARAGAQIGIDLTTIGQRLVSAGQQLAPRLNGNLLDNTSKPLLLPSDLTLIENTLKYLSPQLVDIQSQASHISIAALPLSTAQRGQLQQYLGLAPQLPTLLQQGLAWLAPASWLLGVDSSRSFLVETMDRGELRGTGGFTGQYGMLTVNAGRISPITLTNIALVEYADNSPTYGDLAPDAYRSWWPFANWGLRDANLSADFPTSAHLMLERYYNDFQQNPDGVITFTPAFIQHILLALGPLRVPQYNEVVTAQNLEQRLHFYQLDGNGIAIEKQISGATDDESARKQFTAALAHELMNRIRQVSFGELVALAKQAYQDLKTRDLQIYFTDPQVEDQLVKYGLAGQLDRSTQQDGLYIVQMNVSVSKASDYVQTTFADTIALDAAGGATHHLQMKFVYNENGPVYGFDTYRDYVRVYVPEGAQLLSGSGFDQGYDHPLCGGYLGDCPATNVYPGNELLCPSGGYDAGYASAMLNDPYQGDVHPLDELGAPTNIQSDEPGRAMFGGYIVIPKNCTLTATLSWYVPPEAATYSLLAQRQAGTTPEVQLTIQVPTEPCAGQAKTVQTQLTFQGTLMADKLFTLPARNGQTQQDCS